MGFSLISNITGEPVITATLYYKGDFVKGLTENTPRS